MRFLTRPQSMGWGSPLSKDGRMISEGTRSMSDSAGMSSLANIPKNDVGSFGSRRRISSFGLKYPFLAFIQAINDFECFTSASSVAVAVADDGPDDGTGEADTDDTDDTDTVTARLSKVRAARWRSILID